MLLLEAGPDHDCAHTPAGVASANFHLAAATPGRTWPDLTVRRHPSTAPVAYLQGRGVGGGSALNAMVSMIGQPGDYDRWVKLGATGWGWRDVAPVFAELERGRHVTPTGIAAALRSPNGPLSACADYDVPGAIGMAPARLMLDEAGRRRSTNDLYLETARTRPNLVIRGDVLVDSLLFDGPGERRVVGVRLASGEGVEAAHVVLSAGAIGSPRLLLRSGIDLAGIGLGLRDHPAMAFRVPSPIGTKDGPLISAVGRFSSGIGGGECDLQFLPVDWVGDDGDGKPFGVLLVALMEVRSTGRVTVDQVEVNALDDDLDAHRLAAGVRMAADALTHLGIAPIGVDATTIDASASTDDILKFVVANLADYQHACGTAKMGRARDDSAVVDVNGAVMGYSGLSVIDASVFPDLPRANPNLTTVMVAERLAGFQMLRES